MNVVAGMAMQDGLVLLGRRKALGKRGGLWEMPGGKVEDGEGAFDALKREWMEELGIGVEVGAYIASASLDIEIRFSVYLYQVKIPDGVIPQLIDHDELKWTSLRFAVEYLPCSPALYAHYRHILSWMRDTRSADEQLGDFKTTHAALVAQGEAERAKAILTTIADIRSRMT